MKVWLLGAGPGDPGLLTLKARDILARADVIVNDALANERLLEWVRPDAELCYVGKVAGCHALPQDKINELLVAKAREGKLVARLKGGDPYMFGRGGEEAEALVAAGIPFEEVPGVSSTIAAPAYAGIPLTHRDLTSSVTIVTGHERSDRTGSSMINWQALADSGSTLVFVMGMKNLPNIVSRLLACGMSPEMPAALIHRGTTPRQRSLVTRLADLPDAATREAFTNPSVIVVGRVAGMADSLNWFEKRPLFGRSIVVTRAREQASGMVDQLAALGANVIQCPTIEIRPLADTSLLDKAAGSLASYDWLLFTSANGVDVFWQRLAALGLDSRALAACKVGAIGPATAQSLRQQGIVADLVPRRFVAESVVEALLATGPVTGKKILLPRAAVARDVLPDELRKAGATVDVVPVYETMPASAEKQAVLDLLDAGKLDCITFASSSTVDNFLDIIPAESLLAHPETKLAAIGPITSQNLQKHGLCASIEPEEYTIPALVKAIADYFAEKKA